MKNYKKITIIALLLIVVLLAVVCFGGVYKLKEYKIVNVVPDYKLGMEFDKTRVLNFKLDDSTEKVIYDSEGNVVKQEDGVEYTEEAGYKTVEEKVNSDEMRTSSNFKLAKSILLSRLLSLGAEQYTIRQSETGDITLEISENSNTDYIIQNLVQRGKFKILDEENSNVLLDETYIKSTNIVYGSEDMKTSVYLQIKFNKEGTEKLKEISNTYIETVADTANKGNPEEDTSSEATTKKVKVNFDDTTYMTTYFGEPIEDGTLNLPMGSSSDSTEIQEYVKTATGLRVILTTGVIPIKYEATSQIVSSNINQNLINISLYSIAGILLLWFIYLIIKFKLNGIITSILQIGFISILLLLLRYIPVVITLEGVVGILIEIIANAILTFMFLNNKDHKSLFKILGNYTIICIPLYIIAVIFTFSTVLSISSLGMVLVWGSIIINLYNILFTKTILDFMAEE